MNMEIKSLLESLRNTVNRRIDGVTSDQKGMLDRLTTIEDAIGSFSRQSRTLGRSGDRDPNYRGTFPSADMARDFGALCLSVISPKANVRERAAQIVADGGYTLRSANGQIADAQTYIKDLGTSSDTAGGYLTPDQLASTVIRNVELFGVARRNLTIVPMASDAQFWPKRTGGFTVYYPDEAEAVTKSDMTLGRIRLTAKKWAVATAVSKELDEGALIEIGELLGLEFALAISQAEDANCFMGDGSSAYGGVVGVFGSPNVPSLVMDGGDVAFTAIAPKYLTRLVTATPTWAKTSAADPAYYMSPEIFGLVMELEDNTGRPIYRTNQTEGFEMKINGYPVREVNAAPGLAASGVSTAFVAFGSLRLWGMLGQRRMLSIERSNDVLFWEDQVAIKAIPRQGIQEADGTAMTRLETASA